MNLFPLVKCVLDELYSQIPLTSDDEKDRVILDELRNLREMYPKLINGISINYSDPITRFAYMYRYVASHAYATYALLGGTSQLHDLFEKREISVSCLGGGPGSDLLGILKYVNKNKKMVALKCRVYDREERWRESLSSVCNQLSSCHIFPTFRPLDITEYDAQNKYPELLDSDLFTMSFFISELYSKKEQTQSFFATLFKKAKTHSWFIFLDNSSDYPRKQFDELINIYNQTAGYNSLRLIKKSEKSSFPLEVNEQPQGLEPYYSRFGKSERRNGTEAGLPKSSSWIGYRIYCKM